MKTNSNNLFDNRRTRMVLLMRFSITLLCFVASLTSSLLADEPTVLNRDPAIGHAVIEAAGAETPRADTASVAELPGGKLLVVYHKYEHGKESGQDKGRCRIWMRSSTDGGRNWIDARMLVDIAPGDMNVQAPALLRLPSGELLMICLRAHGTGSSSSMCLLRSRDDGCTFREEPPIWEKSKGQWLQGGASALVLLRSGRILLPFHGGSGNQWKQTNSAGCFVSDDSGYTWCKTPAQVELPKRGAMEASVAELDDGELVMSLRTQLGGPYLARSRDRGETWTTPEPSGLESGESCTCLRRIPGTNDLLLLWNHSKYIPKGHHHFGERTPLTAAISTDAGRTWKIVGDLAAGSNDEYTNLGCTFTSAGKAVITYMFCSPAWKRDNMSLRAMVIDRAWFCAAATAGK
jgi:sialidase-1